MIDKDFIAECYNNAARHKRNRWDVKELDEEECVNGIYNMLKSRTFTPAVPRLKTIHDKSSNKERKISVVPFYPDGVIQQCIVEVMRPAMERHMYPWSCASLPGRGIKRASIRTRRLLGCRAKTKYCLKLDIHHYYPSIDHDIMIDKLSHRIKDKEFLDLVRLILDVQKTGLPIGFYLSQWLSNFYLEDLDWYIHSLDGVYGMVRYMDDIVILGPNKRKLRKALILIVDYMKGMKLELKSNYQIFRVDDRGIDFVGYRFYHDHVTLRRKNFLKLTRQCRRIYKRQQTGLTISYQSAAGFISRTAQLKHCDSRSVFEKYINKINMEQIKEVIRNESKRIHKP